MLHPSTVIQLLNPQRESLKLARGKRSALFIYSLFKAHQFSPFFDAVSAIAAAPK